jgi:hypothetical protein
MARVAKSGLDYFPLDVTLFGERKIKRLKVKYGPLGITIFIYILCEVYKSGYYLKVNIDDLSLDIVNELGSAWCSESKVREVILYLAEIGLIEDALVSDGVITSHGMQAQYKRVLKESRRQLNMIDYLLVNPFDDTHNDTFNQINAEENVINVTSISNNDAVMQQSKVNKSKEKESKENDQSDKPDRPSSDGLAPPTLHPATGELIKRGFITEHDFCLPNYNKLFQDVSKRYSYEDIAKCSNYIIARMKEPIAEIEEKFGYFSSSLINNLKQLKERDKP